MGNEEWFAYKNIRENSQETPRSRCTASRGPQKRDQEQTMTTNNDKTNATYETTYHMNT